MRRLLTRSIFPASAALEEVLYSHTGEYCAGEIYALPGNVTREIFAPISRFLPSPREPSPIPYPSNPPRCGLERLIAALEGIPGEIPQRLQGSALWPFARRRSTATGSLPGGDAAGQMASRYPRRGSSAVDHSLRSSTGAERSVSSSKSSGTVLLSPSQAIRNRTNHPP